MRILPYRTVENVIDGVVITFVEITRLKKALDDLKESLKREARGETQRLEAEAESRKWQAEEEGRRYEYLESIVGIVDQPLLVLDPRLTAVFANESFYSTFKTRPEETINRPLHDLGNRQWDIPELRRSLARVASTRSAVEEFQVEHHFESVGKRRMKLTARQVDFPGDEPERILLAVKDVTNKQRS